MLWCAIFLGVIQASMAANIFFCQIVGTKSHRIIALPFLKQLADNGHNVTMVTSYEPFYKDVANLQEIKHGFSEMDEQHNQFQLNSIVREMMKYSQLLPRLAQTAYKTQWFIDLWHRRHQFDLVIIDGAFNDLCLPFLDQTSAPLVYLDTTGLVVPHHATLGLIHNPATIMYLVTPYSISSLLGRLLNVLFFITGFPVWKFSVIRPTENEIRKILPNTERFSDLEASHLSLILSNSHHSLDGPVPLLPNIVEIACTHCQPGKDLPKDLVDFMAGDEEIIYISFGSHVKSSDIPKSTLDSLLSALEKLPYKVLWKFDEPENVIQAFPSNVKTAKWFPQQDILCHHKTKVFVTHGGLLSIHEAKYHGVPMVVLPLYGDQPKNAWAVKEAGVGVYLSWSKITEESFHDAVQEVATKKEYKERVSKISHLIRDQPETPKERAVWWLEYIIRNNGAAHLNKESFARHLPWPRILLMDVLIVVATVFLFVLLLARCTWNFLFSVKQKQE